VDHSEYRQILEDCCKILNESIQENTYAFVPLGPFKQASARPIDSTESWRVISLTSETLLLQEAKVNKAGDTIIFGFISPNLPGTWIEMRLEVAEKHLSGFRGDIVVAAGVVDGDSLSAALNLIRPPKIGKQKPPKAPKPSIEEKQLSNSAWGTW
jgi:hypothetical protein